ncbi:pimeloyl-ACP methyl ester carboxylesterase [Asanoa ferruginea]|uniref:Pimeloyl-ACP methyl ester carboxylesterase n=1 Tax=Asanoa ferruginea TaxID=53367 RepID=A0A3D9ZBN5_9ACTN|nr:alpha/beta hydrolase [Asanoa ferruginea]REF94836.1 pimeloyl-ACP methyl ester carboxylesterase [Asanoa ferruginea]GIF45585.1 putative hydrolase (alpha/beta hydrolase fold) [Asanoa ferruginea]
MATPHQSDPVITALHALAPGAGLVSHEMVRANGRRLRWVETTKDTGGPTVVFTAGAGDTVLDWAAVLPALADEFHVVAYDRAGLGASDPQRRLTIPNQVDDLVALLDQQRGPVLLAGHSWGGLLAEFATAARPDAVQGLVLIDATHEEVMAAVPVNLRIASDLMLNWMVVLKSLGLFQKQLTQHARAFAVRCTDDPEIQGLLTGAYLHSYASRGQVAAIRAENRLASRVAEARRTRAAMTLPDLPVTVLTATSGKPPKLQALSAELADQTAAGYPRGTHIVVDDSGHYIHQDQPAATVAAIKATAGQLPSVQGGGDQGDDQPETPQPSR